MQSAETLKSSLLNLVSSLVERVEACEAQIAGLLGGKPSCSEDVAATAASSAPEPATKPDEPLIIWTDGACEPNPGVGGWGWHRSDGYYASGGERESTNNRMELTAIIEALRILPDGAVAKVFSDSQYCIKGATEWREGWRKSRWLKKGQPMLNRDLWLALEDELNRLTVTFEWVRGHNGDVGNEQADFLAGSARKAVLNSMPGHEFGFQNNLTFLRRDCNHDLPSN